MVQHMFMIIRFVYSGSMEELTCDLAGAVTTIFGLSCMGAGKRGVGGGRD